MVELGCQDTDWVGGNDKEVLDAILLPEGLILPIVDFCIAFLRPCSKLITLRDSLLENIFAKTLELTNISAKVVCAVKGCHQFYCLIL